MRNTSSLPTKPLNVPSDGMSGSLAESRGVGLSARHGDKALIPLGARASGVRHIGRGSFSKGRSEAVKTAANLLASQGCDILRGNVTKSRFVLMRRRVPAPVQSVTLFEFCSGPF